MKRLKMSSKINNNDLPVRKTDPEFIGLCKHLDKFEVLALSYFRLWYNGNEGRKKAERDFRINLGYVEGYKATRSLGRLFELLLTQSKRKLISLPIGDARYNEDERWFAELLASSVEELDKEKSNNNVKGSLIKNSFITSTMGRSFKLKLEKSI